MRATPAPRQGLYSGKGSDNCLAFSFPVSGPKALDIRRYERVSSDPTHTKHRGAEEWYSLLAPPIGSFSFRLD